MLNLDIKPFAEFHSTMCEYPAPAHHTTPDSAPLEDFHTLFNRKYTGSYGNYYDQCEAYRVDAETAAVYQELHNSRETYAPPVWKSMDTWNGDDVIAWLFEVAQNPMAPIHEAEIPFAKFRKCNGYQLKLMNFEDVCHMMDFPGVSRDSSRKNAEVVYAALERLRFEENTMPTRGTVLRTTSYPYYENLHDLDPQIPQNTSIYPADYNIIPTHQMHLAGEEAEDRLQNTSPDYSYGSDTSRSEDELKMKCKDQKRPPGRPPGRPKGTGKKPHNRVKNLSVPEFLASLLQDPNHCPSKIKWENYKILQFRFVKPDEVAKLWGLKKQNEKMSFEKFSRAMRYHYKNKILQSVTTARLVYQFGENGKHLIQFSHDPNFDNIKLELSM